MWDFIGIKKKRSEERVKKKQKQTTAWPKKKNFEEKKDETRTKSVTHIDLWIYASFSIRVICAAAYWVIKIDISFAIFFHLVMRVAFERRGKRRASQAQPRVESENFSWIHYSVEWQANLIILIKKMSFFIGHSHFMKISYFEWLKWVFCCCSHCMTDSIVCFFCFFSSAKDYFVFRFTFAHVFLLSCIILMRPN